METTLSRRGLGSNEPQCSSRMKLRYHADHQEQDDAHDQGQTYPRLPGSVHQQRLVVVRVHRVWTGTAGLVVTTGLVLRRGSISTPIPQSSTSLFLRSSASQSSVCSTTGVLAGTGAPLLLENMAEHRKITTIM